MKAKERVFNNVTEQRRKTMSKIRGKNTTIEVTISKGPAALSMPDVKMQMYHIHKA